METEPQTKGLLILAHLTIWGQDYSLWDAKQRPLLDDWGNGVRGLWGCCIFYL